MHASDRSWKALLNPGHARTYFVGHHHIPLHPTATGYDRANAWWLAELSRLIYRQTSQERGRAIRPPSRHDILQAVGLREIAFFDTQGTQGALIAPLAPTPEPYAILVFRGTNALEDWRDNVQALSVPDLCLDPWPYGGEVHRGFSQALARVWGAIETALQHVQGPVLYTGHSLGAALATLAASQRPPQALYTFGSPRVGNRAFAATLATCPTFRVVHHRDVIPHLPPPVRGLCHVGALHYIAHDGRVWHTPPADLMTSRRRDQDSAWQRLRGVLEHVTRPPRFLTDHAPINYVTHLARDVSTPSRECRPGEDGVMCATSRR